MANFLEVCITLTLMTVFSQVRSDVSHHKYEKGDHVPLYANKVGPFHNPRYRVNSHIFFFFRLFINHP